MDKVNIIAISGIAALVAIFVLISWALDRLARRKLTRHFADLGHLLDPGTSAISPGPQIRGSFHGREVYGYRRLEMVGFTARAGMNGKTIFELACNTPLQFTAFTLPLWPALAELLRLGSPRIPLGDPTVDRLYGFATPDPDRFRAWMAQPDNRHAVLSLLSTLPPSRRQRFRLRSAGHLQLNMPEYLYFAMKPDQVKLLFEELDRLARTLEQGAG